jgi:hypothetical protein
LFSALALVGQKPKADVTLLRGIGAPFTETQGMAVNQIRIKVQNRSDAAQSYRIELVQPAEAQLIAPENPLPVAAGEQRATSVFVSLSAQSFVGGERHALFRISDGHGFSTDVRYELLGPEGKKP